MLVRAFRLTDKLGIVILKSSSALVDSALAGASTLGAVIWWVISIIGAVLLAALGLFALLLRGIARVIGAVLRVILSIIYFFLNFGNRLTGGAARYAGTSAGTAMARRAARAEMEAGLAEDPLRAQNRLLSSAFVVLLAVLIGVVLWATNPARTATSNLAAGGANLALAGSTEEATPASSGPTLPTLVPTTTPIPEILEARGSLAYTVRENAQDDIWVVGVGDRTPLRLTNSSEDDRDPVWSPNGRQLAYTSRQDGNWEIYLYDLFDGSSSRMTYDQSFQGAPRWSPDGEWLVYESYQGNNLDVYIMRVDGSQIERLTDHAASDFSPSWSPDGRRIAFVSWRDGNQDIYVFSLDDPRDAASINLTNTPTRNEDYPVWSPDGKLLAYSALDEGVEKIFVKPTDDPNAVAQVLGRGRTPTWSPDGASLVVAVDSFDTTQLIALPFAGTGFATLVIPVAQGASAPDWSAAVLPQALVSAGGLPSGVPDALFIEQEQRGAGDPPYQLNSLINVDAPIPALSDRVNDSFNALRERANQVAGWDVLGQIEDAFWEIDRLPQPGEERRNWLMTGRAFAINRNAIVGFPSPIEIVREDIDINTDWRIYVRVVDEAQIGQLGEPLRRMPWDFLSRSSGDVDAYNQGGRLRSQMPSGYYIDLTQLAADYGWERVPAGSDWRANFNSINYWLFQKRDGLQWYDAMRELYTEGQLGGFVQRVTVTPVSDSQSPQEQASPTPTLQAPVEPLPPPLTIESGGDES
jgi:TolB protein